MTTYNMLDSVNTDHIPRDAQLVAGYVDGAWPTYNELVKIWPASAVVSIATTAESMATVLDVETGDATYKDVPGWVTKMRAKGITPVVYTTPGRWQQVIAYCQQVKVAPPLWWAADWTGEPHMPRGAVACQYANGSKQYPGLAPFCDSSVVSDKFPGIIPAHGQPAGKTSTQVTTSQLLTLLRQATGIIAAAEGITNTAHLPNACRAVLLAIGGAIITAEHVIAGLNK